MFFTAITGVIQMVRLDGGDLFSSSHGRVVLLKAVAVAAMLAVALAAHQQVQARLSNTSELTVGLADRFRRAFTAEAAIGVVVLMFSGWLVSLTPAKVDPLAGESYLPGLEFVDPTSGLQARVSVGPGVVGRNGLKVEIEAPPDGVNNVMVRLIPPANSAPCDIATETGGCEVFQPIGLTGAGTAVLLTDQGVPLMVPGTWTLELSGATGQGVLAEGQARGTFLVESADGSTVTEATTTTVATNVEISVIDSAPNSAGFATTTTSTLAPAEPTG
jgi:copper transport protein